MPTPRPLRRVRPSARLLAAALALLVPAAASGPVSAEPKPPSGDVILAPRSLKLQAALSGRIAADMEELPLRVKAYGGKMTIQSVVPSGTAVWNSANDG